MNQRNVGEYISLLRKKRGLTQAKLGEVIGVSDKTISKWENGDGLPDVGILPSLATALDTSVDSILDGGPIPFTRLLKSMGSETDIARIKLVIVSLVSIVSMIFSLTQLYGYLSLKQQLINIGEKLMGNSNDFFQYDFKVNGMVDLTITAGVVLFFTGFSYLIYKYYKQLINSKIEEKVNFTFFECIMKCLWLLTVVYVASYQLLPLFSFMDGRLILPISTAIYLVIMVLELKSLFSLKAKV